MFLQSMALLYLYIKIVNLIVYTFQELKILVKSVCSKVMESEFVEQYCDCMHSGSVWLIHDANGCIVVHFRCDTTEKQHSDR